MEYVKKSEVQPWNKRFDECMSAIRERMRDEGITFTYKLVGSAKRNLVIRHHNKGFDCDFQVCISKNRKNLRPEEIKKLFMKQLDEFMKGYGFDNGEDSTSSITIKLKDVEKSKIEFGYDIVILFENKILRHNKEENKYTFEPLPDFEKFADGYMKIKGNEMWTDLRCRYYKKKKRIENKDGKKSFQLLHEAVNETLACFPKS